MKVSHCYPPNAQKLYHRSGGDVVQLHHNDGRDRDTNFYLVIERDNLRSTTKLANLKNGIETTVHSSTRCVWFKDASLCFGEES